MGSGRSSGAGAWRAVEACLCGVPLWLGAPTSTDALDELVSRLVAHVGGELKPARAFGRPWQVLATERGLLAPGVPGPVAAAADGRDARYWRDGDSIVREAQAQAAIVVACPSGVDATPPAQALWFSEAERWCLFDELLEISNHHVRALLPATAATVARVVAASAPSLAASTAGWPTPAVVSPPSLEVGREVALLSAGWDDPDRFLAGRPELESVSGTGQRRHLRLVNGDAVEVVVSAAPAGFNLSVEDGRWLYARLAAVRDGERVVVRAEPADGIDLIAVATRARLAFDLTAALLDL